MSQLQNEKSPLLYGIAALMVINIAIMVLLIASGDRMDASNWIEIAFWVTAIPALMSTKKWGFAFAIFVLAYTLSTSIGIIIYYHIWLNALRLVNIPIIIYLFSQLFAGKTR
jgi:hypothetical protein